MSTDVLPRVIVVCVDEVRARSLGCYGNDWIETPALDLFASQGAVFDHHFGLGQGASNALAIDTGIVDLSLSFRSPEESTRLPLQLLDAVRRTGAGVSAREIHDDVRPVAHLLEHLDRQPRWLAWLRFVGFLSPPDDLLDRYRDDAPDGVDVDDLLDSSFGDEIGVAPTKSAPSDQTFRDDWARRYAAGIANLDRQLAALFGILVERELLDEVMVIVVSESGKDLEPFQVREWASLSERVLHVPLLTRMPGAIPEGLRVPQLTCQADLGATLRDLFGIADSTAHGRSLLSLLSDVPTPSWRDFTCASAPRLDGGRDYALRSRDWKLVTSRSAGGALERQRLFHQPEDCWEVNDVVQQHRDWAEVLQGALDAYVEATRRPGPFAPPALPDYHHWLSTKE